ncbi:MAG: hypothetical protein ACRDHP_06045 [Ktedonobacterales bacterium]
MVRHTPTIRAGSLILEPPTGDEYVTIPAESDAWFAWLETARTFAYDDPSGRFTARKKRRWSADYWYAFRRRGGRLYETYLGKAKDVTIGRLRMVASRLNDLAGRASWTQTVLAADAQTGQAGITGTSIAYPDLAALTWPRARLSQLIRTRAVDRLTQVMERPLTIVSAPAGYGKTTLLAQWIAVSRLTSAWLSVDERDNDPVRFWRHMCSALEQLIPGHFDTGWFPADARGTQVTGVILSRLIAALPKAPSPTLLICDDYSEIRADNAVIHDAVAYLVERLPPHVHLVLASRTVPPLPLAGLRARHSLLELRAADLQFTLLEAGAFLTRLMHLDLLDDEVAILQTRTEGWIAGLQLAALSLREQTDSAGWIAEFGGENRYIFDYVVEEIINHLPSEIRSFVLRTAVLDRLSAPLCAAVTGSSNSQAMLEDMERTNLFLVPLDDRRGWYRFHHLFADVLRRYLRQTRSNIIPELYSRASVWCEANGLDIEAIDYAFAANAVGRAAQLLTTYAPAALARGHFVLLRDRLERLPDSLLRAQPHLCVAHAYTLYVTGERTLWRWRVRDAEEALAHSVNSFDLPELAILRA